MTDPKRESVRYACCPYCDQRINPGQDVVGVDDDDPFRSLLHRRCFEMRQHDERIADAMTKETP